MSTVLTSRRRRKGERESLYCGTCGIATKYPGIVTERRRRCALCGLLNCADCAARAESRLCCIGRNAARQEGE